MTLLEITSVVLSFVFLILLIQRNVWCWIFGIVSSVLSAILFYQIQLYSECFLYGIYALLGVYGWYVWTEPHNNENSNENGVVQPIKIPRLFSLVIIGIPLSLLVGYISQKLFEDASMPYVDSATTTFGLIATFLEAHRYLSAWIFWIILNLTTAIMYFTKGIYLYAGLMVIYFIFSIVGYITWNKLIPRYNN